MDIGNISVDEIRSAIGLAKDGISVLDTARGTAKKAIELFKKSPTDAAAIEFGMTINELLGQLMDARQAQLEILHRLNELEGAVIAMNKFDDERQRYEPIITPGGSMVLSLKPGDPKGEPPHFLCPNCFEHGKKGILQPRGRSTVRRECHGCGKEFIMVAPDPDGASLREIGDRLS